VNEGERQHAFAQARAYERDGDFESAKNTYLRLGALEEAARVLGVARRHGEAGQILLRSVGVEPARFRELDPEGRKRVARAAAHFAGAGQVRVAADLFVALGDRDKAVELLERTGDASGAAALRAQGVGGGTAAARPAGTGGAAPANPAIAAALALEKEGRIELALDAFRRLKAHAHVGRLAHQQRRFDEAARAFADAGMHFEAAVCHRELGQTAECLQQLKRVPRDDRRYRQAATHAALQAVELDQVDFALENFLGPFLRTGARDDREAEAFYRLAGLFERHHQRDNARETYEKLLETHPTYRDAAARLAAIGAEARGGDELRRIIAEDQSFRAGVARAKAPAPARPSGLDGTGLPDLPDLPPVPGAAGGALSGGGGFPPGTPPFLAPSAPPAVQGHAVPPPYPGGFAPPAYGAVAPGAGPAVYPGASPAAYPAATPAAAYPAASPAAAYPAAAYPAASPSPSPPGAMYSPGPAYAPAAPAPAPAVPTPAPVAPAPAAPAPAPAPAAEAAVLGEGGLVAGRYRLEKKIGQGGMASVYRARDLELEETLAIKFFAPAAQDDQMLSRFKSEVTLSRQLNHPNIIRLYDIGTYGTYKFITMELLEGSDLHHVMGERPMDFRLALDYLIQACGALQLVHDRGVIHRDIKPDNFFVTREGVLKVMDFGIAKRPFQKGVTVAGMIAGTPEYMAPEQVNDFSSVSHLADIYALGIIAYRMFTGTLPFVHAELMPLLVMHVTERPEPPRKRNPAIPAALEALVLKLLEKLPAKRPQSCREIAAQLADIKAKL
jgi:serine/threonine-protein kinase